MLPNSFSIVHVYILLFNTFSDKQLSSIISYIYNGEVNIELEDLNSFLAVAQDLKIKGLADVESKSGRESRSSCGGGGGGGPPRKKPKMSSNNTSASSQAASEQGGGGGSRLASPLEDNLVVDEDRRRGDDDGGGGDDDDEEAAAVIARISSANHEPDVQVETAGGSEADPSEVLCPIDDGRYEMLEESYERDDELGDIYPAVGMVPQIEFKNSKKGDAAILEHNSLCTLNPDKPG